MERQINLSLRQLRAFAELARLGNFGRAAESLGISQSALSASIMQFEDALGLRLFDRTTRRVEILPFALDMLPRVERILSELHGLVDDAHSSAGGRRGRIVISCLSSVGVHLLPAAVNDFLRIHPNVSFSINDWTTTEIHKNVLNGKSDLGLCGFGGQPAELHFEGLLKDPFCVVAPRDHDLARSKRTAWKDILKHPFLAFPQGTHTRDAMDAFLHQAGHVIQPMHEAFQFRVIAEMIRQGHGIAVAPRLSLSKQNQKEFYVQPVTAPKSVREIGIVTRIGRSLPPVAALFADHLKSNYRAAR